MHIKKLEISGFKSFVDRTVIHFDHDVIGIVGPNGCGKSNIVDALRWCMGEQSAKHLRGRSMEDVIFSGSESRPAHGLAEVTLTFDNSDDSYAQSLPIEYRDYAEIAVCRRLFRDGTSEYLINGAQVRLRDITDLFLGTGVGTKAYSIVEQGRIGQIVSARPQDRRLFIEEAAGVTKYRQRRKQADRKLEMSRQNLLRLTDIVNEIDRTRSSLRRQAAKAERFIRYRGEVEELTLHQAAHRLLELTVVERAESEQRSLRSERSAALRRGLDERDADLTKAREEAGAVESRADEAARVAYEAANRVSSLQASYERGKDRLAHLRDRLDNARTVGGELAGRLERLAEEESSLEARQEELAGAERGLREEAEKRQAVLSELESAERSASSQVAEVRRTLHQLTSRVAADEVRQQSAEKRQRIAGERRGMVEQELTALAGTLQGLAERLTSEGPEKARAEEAREAAEQRKSVLKHQLSEAEPQLTQAANACRQAHREFDSRQSRLEVLSELDRRMEGVRSGAKSLMESGQPGLRGLFADCLEVPEHLTDAIAGLLGDRLEAVVAEEPERLLGALQEIKAAQKGRVRVISPRPFFQAGSIPGWLGRAVKSDEEVIGFASELVKYSESDDTLVRALLGGSLIVRDSAYAAAAASKYGVLVVALDGTLGEPDGGIVGGSVAAPQMDRKREIAELARELEERAEQLKELDARHEELASQVKQLRQELAEAGSLLHEAQLRFVGADKDLSRMEAEHASAVQRQQRLETEAASLRDELALSEQEALACQEALKEGRAEAEQLQQQLEEAEAELGECKQRVAEHASHVTEQKVRLAQLIEQKDAVESSLTRVREARRSTSAQQAELERSAQDASVAMGETAARLMHDREARQAAEQEAENHQRELESVRTVLESIRALLAEGESQLRTMRSELSDVDAELAERDMKLQKLSLEREHLLSSVTERFRGLDLRRVVGDYHARPAPDEEHRRRIDELNKLIDRMGPVNLDAKVEYEEAEQRYEELSVQQKDIEKAVEDLEQAIRHMDKESKRRLKETFKVVNELFIQTFRRMFKGGRAQLVLTDPDNLLETGVDIVAQPPGKKLGTVELMSGGEKALTAASLIFAIFQHRPSPFCVLDEVDAPLDEANVGRYNEAIRSMTDKSQFIVITHIKKTMQSVDLLYGVTMGEPGVSRVVSVKVNEHAKPRTDSNAQRAPRHSGAPPVDDAASEESSQVA